MDPVELKDDIVDAWYTNASGEELTEEVVVPEEVQEEGAAAVEDYVYDHIECLSPGATDVGFTQTW